MKKLLIAVFAIVIIIYGLNYLTLQIPMNQTISGDPRNDGIKFSVRYNNYVNPTVLVLDLKNITGEKSRLDVFRVFLQYAEKMQTHSFSKVIFASNWKSKFYIEGDYFKELGEEYGTQNPVYTARTFPGHVFDMNGTAAYVSADLGLFGLSSELDDFGDFFDKWFLTDWASDQE